MSDLVERLRGRARFLRDRKRIKSPELMEDAAARITELETALAEARRQALEEAAKVAGELEVSGKPSTMEWANCMAHARDIAQAIRALASDPLLDRQGKEGV